MMLPGTPNCIFQEEHVYGSEALIQVLLLYSLDVNPVEEVFAKVEYYNLYKKN